MRDKMTIREQCHALLEHFLVQFFYFEATFDMKPFSGISIHRPDSFDLVNPNEKNFQNLAVTPVVGGLG